ncbi:hypothetical protein BT96DRAFT_932625 [Gymnopus androsaceus JB14]|uniref:Uncharacterized protein n=1 Tax=Gymnopus androsaceus JB14 TaxID=1447944 RepID=A0A6A4ICX4_9AGAR|nr:hypothetical protein BT96DRAFT_932625 [Gymnopus androsaceus JB14]
MVLIKMVITDGRLLGACYEQAAGNPMKRIIVVGGRPTNDRDVDEAYILKELSGRTAIARRRRLIAVMSVVSIGSRMDITKTHNGGGLGSANPGIGLSTTGLNDGGGTGATNQKNNNQNTGHKYGPRTNVATALEQDGVTCKFLAILRVPTLSLFLPQL